jgi:hypothetical protein
MLFSSEKTLKYKYQFEYYELAKIRFRPDRFNFSSGLVRSGRTGAGLPDRFQLWITICCVFLEMSTVNTKIDQSAD